MGFEPMASVLVLQTVLYRLSYEDPYIAPMYGGSAAFHYHFVLLRVHQC